RPPIPGSALPGTIFLPDGHPGEVAPAKTIADAHQSSPLHRHQILRFAARIKQRRSDKTTALGGKRLTEIDDLPFVLAGRDRPIKFLVFFEEHAVLVIEWPCFCSSAGNSQSALALLQERR